MKTLVKLFNIYQSLGLWEHSFTDSFTVTLVSDLVGGLNTAVQSNYMLLRVLI